MANDNPTLDTFYENWQKYQDQLKGAIAPLTTEQLALRAAPDLRTVGEIATHIIGARVGWFTRLMGEGDEEVATLGGWDGPGEPVRQAAELVQGLDQSWALMAEALGRWSPADMAYVFEGERGGEPYALSRSWVIWHLIEHDLHHGGELSITLGMHGVTAIDL